MLVHGALMSTILKRLASLLTRPDYDQNSFTFTHAISLLKSKFTYSNFQILQCVQTFRVKGGGGGGRNSSYSLQLQISHRDRTLFETAQETCRKDLPNF